MRATQGCIAAAIILASACFGAPAAAQAPNGRPAPTLVGDAVREEIASDMTAIVGRFVSLRGGPIAARVAGAVDKVFFEIGDRVEAGQPLIRMALDRLEAEQARQNAFVALAAARIQSAKASLRLAQQAATRLARLKSSPAYSEALLSDKQREAERAAADVKVAEADHDRARADLRLANVALAYAEVRAPYGGVVAERHVDVGGFVALGEPVATLVGDRALEIEAEAPTDRMGGVQPGALAEVRYGDATFTAPVRAVLPRETGVSRTRAVRFGPLPQELQAIAITNAAVAVAIPATAPRPVVTVHKDAIIREGAGTNVIVANPGAEAGLFMPETRWVVVGEAIGGRFIVLDGLKPGEIVVVRGNESVDTTKPIKLEGQPDTKAAKP
mgnify:CR=1 FL=1